MKFLHSFRSFMTLLQFTQSFTFSYINYISSVSITKPFVVFVDSYKQTVALKTRLKEAQAQLRLREVSYNSKFLNKYFDEWYTHNVYLKTNSPFLSLIFFIVIRTWKTLVCKKTKAYENRWMKEMWCVAILHACWLRFWDNQTLHVWTLYSKNNCNLIPTVFLPVTYKGKRKHFWYLTNRLHFSVSVYCNKSQMTSKNKKVRHETKSSGRDCCWFWGHEKRKTSVLTWIWRHLCRSTTNENAPRSHVIV